MRKYSKTVFLTLFVLMVFFILKGESFKMKKNIVNLQKTIGAWTRPDSARIINSKNIFDYMNGAGELYLGYSFNHLEVYEYTAANQKNILVELYFMETSDDAFGLLSMDWGGEPVTLNQSSVNKTTHTIAPSGRALYGKGLLRIRSDNIYARIMAYNETAESKEAVLSLGKAIAFNSQNYTEPELLKILPIAVESNWKLQKDKIGYFHSYLVLNSFYYISHKNILNIGVSTEAVTAPFENISDTKNHKRIQFLFVKYENPENALYALENFHKAYLPEYKKDFITGSKAGASNFFKIEDGWLGYKLHKNCLAIVFECPDKKIAGKIINQIEFDVVKQEEKYEK